MVNRLQQFEAGGSARIIVLRLESKIGLMSPAKSNRFIGESLDGADA